jgi:hypothetical protein
MLVELAREALVMVLGDSLFNHEAGEQRAHEVDEQPHVPLHVERVAVRTSSRMSRGNSATSAGFGIVAATALPLR